MTHLNINQIKKAVEPGLDSREAALFILNKQKHQPVANQVRNKPCSDCAVESLYVGIAGCCIRHLKKDECKDVANHWTCHNGGRCEGAYQALVESN